THYPFWVVAPVRVVAEIETGGSSNRRRSGSNRSSRRISGLFSHTERKNKIMPNEIVRSIPEMLTFSGVAAMAALKHGPAHEIDQNTGARINADRTALLESRDAYEHSRTVLAQRRALLIALVQTVREFLTLSRDNLKPYFGGDYSKAWDILGLIRSLMIPRQADLLHPILDCFAAYFAAHPEREIVVLNITAARAEELSIALMEAIAAVTQQEVTVDRLLALRDEKARKLRKRLAGLRDELKQLLEPTDTLWMAFGFNMPGVDKTPAAPENIAAVVVNETTAMLSFPPSSGAKYYRIYQRVLGVDPEPVAVGSCVDPDFTFEDLPRHASIKFSVSAVNNAGESALSPPTLVVID
ncbi:MAG: hypothetical protein JWM68_3702, partial [Verrucomicrobiales bacterium]|nr:hypothetical protein [Verrucomicrobiales bacterium]